MAITWGTQINSGSGNGMRLGYEFTQSPSSVGAGTGSVSVTVRLYLWTEFSASDSMNTLSWSGSFGSGSDSVSISHGGSGGQTLVRTMSRTVNTSFNGSVASSISASFTGLNAVPGTATVSGTHNTAQRPFSAPKALTNLTSSRGSNNSITTTWKNNPTTGQPYTSILVRRSVNGGDYTDEATLSGGATSYTQSGLTPNRTVRYAMRAQNSAGNSVFAYGPTLTIPANNPATPTNAQVTRTSDTSHTVSWTNVSPTSSTAPYEKIQIQRWTLTGDAFVTVATITGAPTSYVDRTTVPNQQYRYRVIAHNSGGASGEAYTDYISTTPGAPGTPKATKNSAGDITVTWSLAGVTKNTNVEVWLTEAGADQPARHVLLPANTTSWTHVNPLTTSTWAYRIKAVNAPVATNETGVTLFSAFSARSNTVQLLTNPLAPTGLAPASVVRDGTAAQTLTWIHNEVDGTDQTAFQVEHRAQGETVWVSTGKINSTASSYVLPAGTYTNGEVIEWRVSTWGLFASPSPFSAPALITLSTPPQATILAPAEGAVILGSSVGVSWEFYDAEGHPQAQWRATLLDANGDTVETVAGTGTAADLPAFDAVLLDGEAYAIEVVVRDSTGLWSAPASVGITALYPLPAAPVVEATWDPDTGSVVVTITNPAPLGEEVEATYNELWRSINGDEWILIATGLELNSAMTDYLPALNSSNYYKAVAVSDLPSSAESDPGTVDTSETHYWVWLNAGPAFSTMIRMRDNAQLTDTSGPEKHLHIFAGREYPVEFMGEQSTGEFTFAARFAPESSSPQDVKDFAKLAAPACIRTPDGQRIFVSVGKPTISYARVTAELSLSLTQVDHDE